VSASTVAQPENMTWEANQEQWKRDQYDAANQANAGSGWAQAGMSLAGALPAIKKTGDTNGWWGTGNTTSTPTFDSSAFSNNYAYGDVM